MTDILKDTILAILAFVGDTYGHSLHSGSDKLQQRDSPC